VIVIDGPASSQTFPVTVCDPLALVLATIFAFAPVPSGSFLSVFAPDDVGLRTVERLVAVFDAVASPSPSSEPFEVCTSITHEASDPVAVAHVT
jgi:hypothetical protein